MKREVKDLMRVYQCCPGHDDWPCDTYKNRRSKKARSRDIAKEHRYVRRVKKQNLKKEIEND
ncbi:hypothetical protein PMW_121 [Pseudomonas phage phiPMW]|uniref:Uncharacterized protein n=1 Tax=Pseudomonas phage phiPMW TaxID=1815582 RepID=A0A1S5R1H1_9CAUD|nr:hypothetical protein FDG97_gp229 [Pseudomonas phage phiPMW]ANA49246.1 hypothetical protein PMW_121 [Pseudomonas phage phiPMW]